MEGKIVVYSDRTGLGKIIDRNKRTFDFSVEEWNEYDTLPKIGQTVSFMAEGKRAKRIVVASEERRTSADRKKGSQTFPPSASRQERSGKSTAHTLRLSRDIQSCLQEHFAEVLQTLGEHRDLLEERRGLDYDQMRRFLNTAYNNLIEIDPSFSGRPLESVYQTLRHIHAVWGDFLKRSEENPNAYEQIFLRRQEGYKSLKERTEENRRRIEELREVAAHSERELKSAQMRLQKSEEKSPIHAEESERIKTLKRTLVDAIHEAGKLTDANCLYRALLDDFQKTHRCEFEAALNRFVETHARLLTNIRDALAYRFDSMMWERARRSKAIREFFTQAGILEEFSAVTYLKYYLKTLDETKLSEEHKRLTKLLHYLQSQRQHHILCIDDDPEFMYRVREAAGEIDRNIGVVLTPRIDTVLPKLKTLHPDILMINPRVQGMKTEIVVEYARKNLGKVHIILLASKIGHDLLRSAKRMGVDTILTKSSSKDELKNHFLQYFHDEGVPCSQD